MKWKTEFVKDIISQYIDINSIYQIGEGNHSQAFMVNGNLVFKFPKHIKASQCIDKEIAVLKNLNNKLNVSISDVVLVGNFNFINYNYTFYASHFVKGKCLTRKEFENLSQATLETNADILSDFMIKLHRLDGILPIKRKDSVLLHGDLSLNHIRFDENNLICGVIDFADARTGRFMSDFIYLTDDEDEEEFGAKFGNMVLEKYLQKKSQL